MARTPKQQAALKKAQAASAAKRKAASAAKRKFDNGPARTPGKMQTDFKKSVDKLKAAGVLTPHGKPRKAITQRAISNETKRRTGFSRSQLDNTRMKVYNLGGMTITAMQQAKRMKPPKGISADLHMAVLDDAIAAKRADNAYRRQYKGF